MRCTTCFSDIYVTSDGSVGNWTCEICGTKGTILLQDQTREKWLAEQPRVPQIAKEYIIYNLPGKVVDIAVGIYTDVIGGDTLKGDKRKAMLCKCAYEAFLSLGMARDPILLARRFGVSDAKLREAQNDFTERIHEKELKEKYPKRQITAKELLIEFLLLFGIEDAPQEDLNTVIDKIYSNIVLKSRIKSRDIAICVVYWYMSNTGIKTTSEQVRKETGMAKATMTKVLGIISKL